ncbi:MAG: HAMP domain-containing histidine kinase [Gammaproteobacteria bacterium]|nr:HAMP domain-containing histidine kinase [Gammaproteobacteria bacterium]
MRLKTNIFLWVLLASSLPLTVLTLSAITYSEKQYLKEVNREMTAGLNSIVSEIDRRLYYERQMILSLANSRSMKEYLPVMATMTQGDLHQSYFQLTDRLERFLSSFQGVVPGFKSIRVLDNEGNSLIKVRFGVGVTGRIDGIESTPYVEDELNDPDFVKQLRELVPDDLSFISLPVSRWEDDENERGPVMLDAVYPLVNNNKTVGYLLVGFSGDLVDKILDVVPRQHNGKLLVAELNPDNEKRDGMLLYDDISSLRLTLKDVLPAYLKDNNYGLLWNEVRNKPDGNFRNDDNESITYYHEYLPYPNQLASWVVSARVNYTTLAAPFDQIRLSILILVLVAVGISVVLANIGAKKIARPISDLSDTLKRYADGEHRVRVRVGGTDEIQQMEGSFNYMADTLEHAQEERDHAHKMMMQNSKLASIGEMAAGIGHEINNPLNNISSLIQLMKRGLPEEEKKLMNDLDSLNEETSRATSIVSGILNFARQVPPQYTRFNGLEWLEETVRLVAQHAKRKQIECHIIADTDIIIEGDRAQLQQVMVNLILNAIQASGRDSEIIISIEKMPGKHLIHIEDHGKGIQKSDLERIFDPFFTTKDVGEGSGLGLSISLGIVERHDGRLLIKNNSDGGVTATVVLPVSNDK